MSLSNNIADLLEVNADDDYDDAVITDGTLDVATQSPSDFHGRRGGISWVSTELHLHAAHNWGDRRLLDILENGASNLFCADRNGLDSKSVGKVDVEVAITTACWLGLLSNEKQSDNNIDDKGHSPFLFRRFSTLSQGEQKLLLIAQQYPNDHLCLYWTNRAKDLICGTVVICWVSWSAFVV